MSKGDNKEKILKLSVKIAKNVKKILEITIGIFENGKFDYEIFGEALYLKKEIKELRIRLEDRIMDEIAKKKVSSEELKFLLERLKLSIDIEGITKQCVYILKNTKKANEKCVTISDDIKELAEQVIKVYLKYIGEWLDKIESGENNFGFERIQALKEEVKNNNKSINEKFKSMLNNHEYGVVAEELIKLSDWLGELFKEQFEKNKIEKSSV